MPDPLFTLQGVSFAYRALPVLHDLNLQFQSNQQWACLGPNGSGKTTLAKLISRQSFCRSGELTFSDTCSHIAYVCFEQQKALCDRDTQLDDSEFRSDAQDPGTTVARAILGGGPASAEYQQWVERLGISHILNRGIRFISTGEMRKTLLLRAILSQPQLLILDSPLDGLDLASQAEMYAILELLLQSELRILLLCRQLEDLPVGVSHVLVLNEGREVVQGPAAEVLKLDSVRELMNPTAHELGELPSAAERPYQLDPSQPLLELKDVQVSYGETAILQDVNWSFSRGSHCCIAGPNGCGKTTLLSLINGDNHKAYGQDITLFGQRRGSGESVWDIKQKYGLLNTQLHLKHVRGMKVIEVVVSGFFDTVGLYDDWGDQQRQAAQQWLRALGLENYERHSFDTLSFGMQRMVLLARAMVKSPIILILDEPVLGLDAFHRKTILQAIDHIAANTDTQILYVSHSAGDMPACINQHMEFVPLGNCYTTRIS